MRGELYADVAAAVAPLAPADPVVDYSPFAQRFSSYSRAIIAAVA
jgi:hypothetical protein